MPAGGFPIAATPGRNREALRRVGVGVRSSAILPLILVAVGCAPSGTPGPSVEMGILEVRAQAGPVCPVETEEPDPACEPRPVADARVLVQPGDGRDIIVAEGSTDENGVVRLEVPVGSYIVLGTEVQGLFGVPEQVQAQVGPDAVTVVTLTYDTGIR
jgi:hypothetical protein